MLSEKEKYNIKHSKYKNVGLIYELLLRQISVDLIEGLDNTPAMKILSKYFYNKNSLIREEFKLYHLLLNKKLKNEKDATILIEEVFNTRKKLVGSKLKNEKYNLIKEIFENYGKNIFDTKIENYKLLASIYKIFENTPNNLNPVLLFKSKVNIVEHMVKPKNIKDNYFNNKSEDKFTQILAYRILVEDYNNKFSKILNENQKKLIKIYTSHLPSDIILKNFVNSEIIRLKNILENKKIDNIIIESKLKGLNKSIEPTNSKNIDEKYINMLMYLYKIEENISKI